jgi:hypothetical protein
MYDHVLLTGTCILQGITVFYHNGIHYDTLKKNNIPFLENKMDIFYDFQISREHNIFIIITIRDNKGRSTFNGRLSDFSFLY